MTFPTESDQYLAEFEAPIVEARKPTLPELLDLDILEAVGTEYGKFGVLLLNDEIGSLVNVIKHDCLGKSHFENSAQMVGRSRGESHMEHTCSTLL